MESFVVPKVYAEFDVTHLVKSLPAPAIVFSQNPTNEEICKCEESGDYLVTFVDDFDEYMRAIRRHGILKLSDRHILVNLAGRKLKDAREHFRNEFDHLWGVENEHI